MEQVYNSMLDMVGQVSPPQKPQDTREHSGAFRKLLERHGPIAGGAGSEEAGETQTTVSGGAEPGEQDEPDFNAAAAMQGALVWAAISIARQPSEPAGQIQQPQALAPAPGVEPVLLKAEARTMVPMQLEAPVAAPAVQDAAATPPVPTAGPQGEITAPSGGEQIQAAPAAGEAAEQGRAGGGQTPAEPEGRETGGRKTVLDANRPAQPLFQQKSDATLIRVGDAQVPQETQGRANVERQLAGELSRALRQGDSQVKIQLSPASLGSVQVELTRGRDGALHVLLTAETPETRGLLERSAAGLQGLLSHAGTQSVQVEVQRQQESQQPFYDGRNGADQGDRQQDQPRRERRDEQAQDFLQQLRLGLIPLEAEAV